VAKVDPAVIAAEKKAQEAQEALSKREAVFRTAYGERMLHITIPQKNAQS